METALYLREQGNEVAVVDMLPPWPTDMYAGDPRFMMEAMLESEHCHESGVGMYYDSKVLGFSDGKLNIESTKDGKVQALDVDLIVLSTGVKPNDALYNELLAAGVQNVWKTGDANATGKIFQAVMNSSKFALRLG
jgi:hypothetical protein